jgi:Protein of unknown function (DUF3035)
MRNQVLVTALAVGIGVGLSGCDSAKQALGMGKNPPDEFQVVTHAPLSMPPDYNLVAPKPGAPRPQENSAQQLAQTALLSNATAGSLGAPAEQTGTAGEQALLQNAGATGIDPNIRQEVDAESQTDREASKKLVDQLLFWRKPDQPGTVVDPQAEQQRLQQNAALGKPPTTGETPVIKRREKALFEGLFN